MEKINWKPKTDLEKAGLRIVRLLNKNKFQAFFVGGFVRDLFVRQKSDNIDIATDALPEDTESILSGARIPFKQIGKKFGTILAIPDGLQVEITTFRSEGRYSDQRHPDRVEFIREYLDDARRRDFTINAIYFNPVTSQLFDPAGGRKDLKAQIIRFVGDPKKRIDEDPLRMLRGVRFATVLGFKLEKNSFAAIKTRAKLIQSVSDERVKQELDKILLSKSRAEGIRQLRDSGLLRFIVPEFSQLQNVYHQSKKYHLEGSVYDHTLKVIGLLPQNLNLIYAGLFHDIGKIQKTEPELRDGELVLRHPGHQQASAKIFRKFAKKFKFSAQSRDLIEWLILHHDDRTSYREITDRKRVKYSLQPYFPLLLEIWMADSRGNIRRDETGKLKPGNSISVHLGKKILKKINSKKQLIERFCRGEFIIRETKLKPGIKIGEISEDLKIRIILDEVKNETEAKKFLKKIPKST